MSSEVVCVLCDKPESECPCDRYCCCCQGTESIRMCIDGQYYCSSCREACDISWVNSLGR